MAGAGGFRVRTGSVSIEVGPELQRFLERILESAEGTVARRLHEETETLAAEAERLWYTQVEKRTGASGQLETTLEFTETQVRAAVHSKDSRRTKSGKPVVYYVHRPGPNSTSRRRLTKEEYSALMREFRRTGTVPKGLDYVEGDRGRPLGVSKRVPNPKASDGRYLVPELLRKPALLVVKRLVKDLGPEIAAALRRGR